jgi:hypothetical protein
MRSETAIKVLGGAFAPVLISAGGAVTGAPVKLAVSFR